MFEFRKDIKYIINIIILSDSFPFETKGMGLLTPLIANNNNIYFWHSGLGFLHHTEDNLNVLSFSSNSKLVAYLNDAVNNKPKIEFVNIFLCDQTSSKIEINDKHQNVFNYFIHDINPEWKLNENETFIIIPALHPRNKLHHKLKSAIIGLFSEYLIKNHNSIDDLRGVFGNKIFKVSNTREFSLVESLHEDELIDRFIAIRQENSDENNPSINVEGLLDQAPIILDRSPEGIIKKFLNQVDSSKFSESDEPEIDISRISNSSELDEWLERFSKKYHNLIKQVEDIPTFRKVKGEERLSLERKNYNFNCLFQARGSIKENIKKNKQMINSIRIKNEKNNWKEWDKELKSEVRNSKQKLILNTIPTKRILSLFILISSGYLSFILLFLWKFISPIILVFDFGSYLIDLLILLFPIIFIAMYSIYTLRNNQIIIKEVRNHINENVKMLIKNLLKKNEDELLKIKLMLRNRLLGKLLYDIEKRIKYKEENYVNIKRKNNFLKKVYSELTDKPPIPQITESNQNLFEIFNKKSTCQLAFNISHVTILNRSSYFRIQPETLNLEEN